MEEKRNNRSVERKMKDALKNDRARIQVGRISHFGLLEMSRQRIRTGVLESTTSVCPTCQGTGHIRAPSSVALHVLRSLEDSLLKGATHHLTIRTRTNVALYILNQKRAHLSEIELRFGLTITVSADETIANGAHFVIERGEPIEPRALVAPLVTPASVALAPELEDEIEADFEAEMEPEESGETERAGAEPRMDRDGEREERGDDGQRKRRRRRGRGRGGEGRGDNRHAEQRDGRPAQQQRPPQQPDQPRGEEPAGEEDEGEARPFVAGELGPDGQPRKRRRGRRGGRRGRRGGRPGENGHAVAPENRARPDDEAQPGFAPGGFGAISADYDEIDTTPTLDSGTPRPAPQRADRVADTYIGPDEVDTTPTADTQPSRESWQPPAQAADGDEDDEIDTTPRADAPSRADTRPEPAADDDPDRPKRSGWWQRKSFFG
jgi:ribonuclease E